MEGHDNGWLEGWSPRQLDESEDVETPRVPVQPREDFVNIGMPPRKLIAPIEVERDWREAANERAREVIRRQGRGDMSYAETMARDTVYELGTLADEADELDRNFTNLKEALDDLDKYRVHVTESITAIGDAVSDAVDRFEAIEWSAIAKLAVKATRLAKDVDNRYHADDRIPKSELENLFEVLMDLESFL